MTSTSIPASCLWCLRALVLALILSAGITTSFGQSNQQPAAKFNIQVSGQTVQVERWGKGSIGVVIFSHSGDLAAELRKLNKDLSTASRTYFERIFGGNYSLFLWTYPDALLTKANQVIESSFAPGPVLPSPSYRGLSLGVVQQIRKATGLRKICLVGNSLGAGILLWDAAELSKDKDASMVLAAPTPLFLPPNRPSPGVLKRTLVVADPANDPFIPATKDKSYFRLLANGPYPPGYKPSKNNFEAHFIIGENMGLDFVRSLIEQTGRKPQVITFRKLPPMKVGGKAVAPNIRANSKLKVKLTSSNPRVALIDKSGRIAPLRAGTTIIRATQSGDTQWMPAFPVERTLTVGVKEN